MTVKFPVKTIPYEDELISSWLVRLSLANGLDPLILTRIYWPDKRPWTTDIDRSLCNLDISQLSQASSVSETVILKMMLQSHFKKLDYKLHKLSVWNWLIPYGKRNIEIKAGLQYCPLCLQNDSYFKVYWRMAWFNVCHKHGVKLNEVCPNCLVPINIHKTTTNNISITNCYSCSQDLSKTIIREATENQVSDCLFCFDVYKNNFINYSSQKLDVLEWFSLLRFFISLVQLAVISEHHNLQALLASLNVELKEVKKSYLSLRFEMLSNDSRLSLLSQALNIMRADVGGVKAKFKEYSIGEKETLSWGMNVSTEVINLLGMKHHKKSKRRKPTACTVPKIKSEKQVLREYHLILRRNGIKFNE